MKSLFRDVNTLISTLSKMFASSTAPVENSLYRVLSSSIAGVEETSFNGWNGGTYGYTLTLEVPFEIYVDTIQNKDDFKKCLAEKVKLIAEYNDSEHLDDVVFLPKHTNEITPITRHDVFDLVTIEKIQWNGRISEPDFLKRIYNLDDMESYDSRFQNALADIWQHRINNYDWNDDWVFSDDRFDLLNCSDEIFLKFLCEMLHPVVRPDLTETTKLVQAFNSVLVNDKYEIVETTRISGKPIYNGRKIISRNPVSMKKAKEKLSAIDADYISNQINRIESAISNDPSLAIGSSKELLESCCKTILSEMEIPYKENLELPKLVKAVTAQLKLTPDDIPDEAKASEIIKRILSNLASVANGIAELRNSYGSGHGREGKSKGLNERHAKLAAGAATTLTLFLFETYEQKYKKYT